MDGRLFSFSIYLDSNLRVAAAGLPLDRPYLLFLLAKFYGRFPLLLLLLSLIRYIFLFLFYNSFLHSGWRGHYHHHRAGMIWLLLLCV